MKIPKIDLHMHSTMSDGTDTPEELLENVRNAGIELFALTDHDTVKGIEALRRILPEDGPQMLTGVEFSCRDREGKYHILGYHFDPDHPVIREIVEKAHQLRIRKIAMRLDGLRDQFGFSFDETDITWLMSLNNPGKPHIADLIVRYGYAETKDQAIRQYINRIRTHSEYIGPEEAIRGILQSGGIPVLAHPAFGNGDERITGDEMEQRLRKLTGFGLQGVEAFYSGFIPELRDESLRFAEQFGLYVTAGSDYHGKNKPVLPGDTKLDQAHAIPDGMERFLNEVGFQ